jgi:hypothetical protein
MPAPRTWSSVLRSLAALSALAACDPSPDFGPPDPTLPGAIWEVFDLVARDDAPTELTFDFSAHSLTIPAGALPAGTRVTVRVLVSVIKPLPSGVGGTWNYAVQILPETLRFTAPAVLATRLKPWNGLHTLFALPTDASWQRVGPAATSEPNDFYGTVRAKAALDRGGVWTFGITYDEPTPDAGANDANAD